MKKALFCSALWCYLSLFAGLTRIDAQIQPQDKELFFKSDTLIRISLHYIKAKNVIKARESLKTAYRIAEKIKNPYSREMILFEVTDKYLLFNQMEDAYRTAKLMEFWDSQSEAFSNIALKYAELAKFNEAADVTKQIKDDFSRAKTLYIIVYKLTDLELYNKAVNIAREAGSSKILDDLDMAQKFCPVETTPLDSRYFTQFKSQAALLRKCRELIDAAGQFARLSLYSLAENILIKADILSKNVDSSPSRRGFLSEIKNIRHEIGETKRADNER